MGKPVSKKLNIHELYASWIDTKIGSMIAIADDEFLYLLEFVDRRGLETEIEKLRNRLIAVIIPKKNDVLNQIERELNQYFESKLDEFSTPIKYFGSEFQIKVWNSLRKIPFGSTLSYLDIATSIDCPKAVRAVGRVNGLNQLSIIVPCHRVIGKDGELVGYGGGLERKKWLLKHESESVII